MGFDGETPDGVGHDRGVGREMVLGADGGGRTDWCTENEPLDAPPS
jgi:hypothetical protein